MMENIAKHVNSFFKQYNSALATFSSRQAKPSQDVSVFRKFFYIKSALCMVTQIFLSIFLQSIDNMSSGGFSFAF